MYRERCTEHDLAVGPEGGCVLCRRATARVATGRPQSRWGETPHTPRPSRWLAPMLLAAGLGSMLLGGAALAHSHTALPPVVEAEAAPAAVTAPLAPPIESQPPRHTPVVESRIYETPPAPEPAPAPTPPPRDYLGEAYAAMPKGNLYDETRARAPERSAPTGHECPCRRTGGCQVRYYYTPGVTLRARGGSLTATQLPPVEPRGTVPTMQHASGMPSFSRPVTRLR